MMFAYEKRKYELSVLLSRVESSEQYASICKIVIPVYRREYMTDICGYRKSEQDRLREDFDARFVIPEN